MDKRIFKITMSERCYRFKPDALDAHAPRQPGVYEFVKFNEKLEPVVLFVGLAYPGTIYDALKHHFFGDLRPTQKRLFELSEDIYFDFVASADIETPEEFKDIAAALAAKCNPWLNEKGVHPSSGRHVSVDIEEVG